MMPHHISPPTVTLALEFDNISVQSPPEVVHEIFLRARTVTRTQLIPFRWRVGTGKLAEALAGLDNVEIRVPIAVCSPLNISKDEVDDLIQKGLYRAFISRYGPVDLRLWKASTTSRERTPCTLSEETRTLVIEYSSTEIEPAPNMKHETAFFVLGPKRLSVTCRWTQIQVRTPLIVGDLGRGIAAIEAFDTALHTVHIPIRAIKRAPLHVIASYDRSISVSEAKKVVSLVTVLDIGLFEAILGQNYKVLPYKRLGRMIGRPYCSSDPTTKCLYSGKWGIEEHFPLTWPGSNRFFPDPDMSVEQANWIRLWFDKLWLCDGMDKLVERLREDYGSSLSLRQEGDEYLFCFSYLEQPCTPETVRRWPVVITAILELASLEWDPFKDLMHRIFDILHDANAKDDANVWRRLLCALELEGEIPFWEESIHQTEARREHEDTLFNFEEQDMNEKDDCSNDSWRFYHCGCPPYTSDVGLKKNYQL